MEAPSACGGPPPGGPRAGWLAQLRRWPLDRLALTLALAAVPISIAAAETLLALALAARIVHYARGQRWVPLPSVFWRWLAFAVLVFLNWLISPDRSAGWSEIRRLLLVAGLFLVLPALGSAGSRRAAWQAVFIGSGVGSVFLIGDFIGRMIYYHRELAAGGPVSLYLRTGGLLNHWMVFATVEILVVAGLIAFWSHYPECRKRWAPILILNAVAVALSLTRTAWITCLILVVVELAWRRSKWLWLAPMIPLGFYLLAPGAVRSRVHESMQPDYYSNQERLQMLRVGWRLIRERPLAGVGAGKIGEFYRSQIKPGEPVPAYYGHLHNNIAQMAAAQGVPVALAAVLMAASFLVALLRAARKGRSRDAQFASRAGTLALIGFSVAGIFEYTYGHSLALILLSFAVISPIDPCGGQLEDNPSGKLVASL